MSDENLLDFTLFSKYNPSTINSTWQKKIPDCFLAELLVHQPQISM